MQYDEKVITSLVTASRASRIPVSYLMKASALDTSTFYVWKKRPGIMKKESAKKLIHGVEQMAEALLKFCQEAREALGEEQDKLH